MLTPAGLRRAARRFAPLADFRAAPLAVSALSFPSPPRITRPSPDRPDARPASDGSRGEIMFARRLFIAAAVLLVTAIGGALPDLFAARASRLAIVSTSTLRHEIDRRGSASARAMNPSNSSCRRGFARVFGARPRRSPTVSPKRPPRLRHGQGRHHRGRPAFRADAAARTPPCRGPAHQGRGCSSTAPAASLHPRRTELHANAPPRRRSACRARRSPSAIPGSPHRRGPGAVQLTGADRYRRYRQLDGVKDDTACSPSTAPPTASTGRARWSRMDVAAPASSTSRRNV